MITLPQPITSELFNAFYWPSDVAVNYIIDEIERFGFDVGETIDRDHTMIFSFQRGSVNGSLRVQRTSKNFAIEAIAACASAETFLPIEGDWNEICQYLLMLSAAI